MIESGPAVACSGSCELHTRGQTSTLDTGLAAVLRESHSCWVFKVQPLPLAKADATAEAGRQEGRFGITSVWPPLSSPNRHLLKTGVSAACEESDHAW